MLSKSQRSAVNEHNSAFTVTLAQSISEVIEAQRLRYKVFAEEMGAKLPSASLGIDCDMFDSYCEHLLVRENVSNKVIGTYRILPAAQAEKIGKFYSEDEFDMSRLSHLRSTTIEVGRSCVHRNYRQGSTIALLWSGVAHYTKTIPTEYLIGCASIGLGDGGHVAASVYNKLKNKYLSPAEYRVIPHNPLPISALNQDLDCDIPPLIKGYLRLGAYICGEPAWDPDFNTADLFILLPLARINPRYWRHFFEG
jgi:putative hemolysin